MFDDGYKLICVDEMMVTVGTIPSHCWSNKNENAKIDLNQING